MVDDGEKRAVRSLFDVSRVTGANEAGADNDERDGFVGIKGSSGVTYIIILISMPEGRDHIKPTDKEKERKREREREKENGKEKQRSRKTTCLFIKTDHDPAIAR